MNYQFENDRKKRPSNPHHDSPKNVEPYIAPYFSRVLWFANDVREPSPN